jgi:SAM-dependent methyltransferase
MPLLKKALNEAKKQSLSIKFIHGDMRDLNFDSIFDGCFLWQTSFGYFEDRVNLQVLRGINRALKPGGRLVIDVINRDHIARDMPHRIWWEGVDCVFLEEVELDHNTSILHTKRSYIYEDGTPPLEQNSYIRLYSLHELRQLFNAAGFEPQEVSGELHHRGRYLGPASSRIILMGRKRG